MNDGTREIAEDGEAFGLDDFTQVKLIEFAKPTADLLQDVKGEWRRALEHFQHLTARDKINIGIVHRGGGGGTRLLFDDRHFAENFAGTQL